MSARTRLVILVGVLAVVVVAAAVLVGQRGDVTPDPGVDAAAYLAAWQGGDTATLAALVADPADSFTDELAAVTDGLRIEQARYELADVERDGDEATAAFTATLQLSGIGEWRYDGALPLVRADEAAGGDAEWLVDWSPAAVHPDLGDGQRLGRTRDVPERAPITGADGTPLVEARPAVTVGIEPQRVEDREQVKAALVEHLGVDGDHVDAELDRPGVQPDHFVAIVTVPEDRYALVRDAIYPVPGLVFQDTAQRQMLSDGFAQHVLGRTGEITAERLDELGPTYQAGDQVGVSGIEARYEAQLAGSPSAEVQIRDADGSVASVLETIDGTAPQPVATTLDPAVQRAVEAALADVSQPAAVAVVDADGNVAGIASRPLDEELNRAIAGSYPPGSTFKIVTTSALLAAGVTPDTTVECPPTIEAGGRSFKNFESSSLGPVPFATAFAQSCNTAFIGAALDVSDQQLVDAAELFGFNTDYTIGLRTLTGSFPTPEGVTEHAAAAIGQGRVLATPLHMATVGATVIDGTWEPPTLVRDLPTDDAPEPRTLPEGQAATLKSLMRKVVVEGSGTAAAVPGVEVYGKTGTAEYGSGNPPPTHAWFVGVRGDLSVAVLVEDGVAGGQVAAPIAGEVLAALPGG